MEDLCLNDDDDDDNKRVVYPEQLQQNPFANSSQIENDEVEILSEISDEELDIHISYEDDSDSFLWDLRRLFDLDFLDRESSPYPRGDSGDIPGDNMGTVTPVDGAGCPDENNMNIASQQSNQHNVNDIYNGTKEKRLTKNNTSSNLAKKILSCFETVEKKETMVKENIQEKQKENSYKTDKKPLKNYFKKEERNYSTRQKQRYSSSSSSSKSVSSCSCSTGRRRRYTCRMVQRWNAQNHVHNLYPLGEISDIPGENLRVIIHLDGAGCPDENIMNIALLQTNQNNVYDIYDGEPRSSNTCLRNLTRVIHNSDQIKDILFSTGPKEKSSTKSNTPSNLAKNILTWSDTAEKEDSVVKGNIQEKQRENNYKIDKKPLKNYPKNEERKYSTRRKQCYSSSSSSSSSDSSCSCSTRRRKRHTCRMAQCCHTQNQSHNQCQHQCHGAHQSGASRNIIPTSNYDNPYPYSTPSQEFHQYPNFTTPQNFWSNPYCNPPDMVDAAPYPYFPNNTCGDPNYYPQTDMSDIIERMRRLDLTIGQLAQDNNSYNYPPENQHFGDPGNYFVHR